MAKTGTTSLSCSLAGFVGGAVASWLGPELLRWVVGLAFLAMAAWMLVPDRVDADAAGTGTRFGVFGTTLIAFFVAEMGDKTQLATIALAASDGTFVAVVAGTTLGMLVANVPVVFLGERVTRMLPLRAIRAVAAVLFAGMGFLILAQWVS